MNSHEYISLRVINACLKEDVRNIVSDAKLVKKLPLRLDTFGEYQAPQAWLKITGICSRIILLPIQESFWVQRWSLVTPAWIEIDEYSGEASVATGYVSWLNLLVDDLNTEDSCRYHQFINEAQIAERHHSLSEQEKTGN